MNWELHVTLLESGKSNFVSELSFISLDVCSFKRILHNMKRENISSCVTLFCLEIKTLMLRCRAIILWLSLFVCPYSNSTKGALITYYTGDAPPLYLSYPSFSVVLLGGHCIT